MRYERNFFVSRASKALLGPYRCCVFYVILISMIEVMPTEYVKSSIPFLMSCGYWLWSMSFCQDALYSKYM